MSVELDYRGRFTELFIHPAAVDTGLARRAIDMLGLEPRVCETLPLGDESSELSAIEYANSKTRLWILPFRGKFFKRCPGSSQKKVLNCCNYHILNLGSQCDLDCSYCYLQSYLRHKTLRLYSNIEDALLELEAMARDHGQHPFRVGTGEVMDSLSLDPLTLFSHQLIAFFRDYPKWTLEFKTKSAHVAQFLDQAHAGNVVVSWSLNPQFIIDSEEARTANLQMRLAAARSCLDRGFQIAFHLDPLIYFANWREHYGDLVDQICAQFRASDVNVVSMGALRFQPEQRRLMKERFGMKSLVTQAEMFPSEGAKLRYDFQLRNEMFNFVIQRFKSHDSAWRIFLCMETPESWIQSLEASPMKVEGLQDLFKPLPKVENLRI